MSVVVNSVFLKRYLITVKVRTLQPKLHIVYKTRIESRVVKQNGIHTHKRLHGL